MSSVCRPQAEAVFILKVTIGYFILNSIVHIYRFWPDSVTKTEQCFMPQIASGKNPLHASISTFKCHVRFFLLTKCSIQNKRRDCSKHKNAWFGFTCLVPSVNYTLYIKYGK